MKKKQLAYLLLAGLLAASCQQEELPGGGGLSDSGIIFTSDYALSRSIAKTTFSEGDKVGVLGYCLDEPNHLYGESDWNTKKLFVKPEVFYNQELTFDGTGLWEYNYNGEGLRKWYDNPEYQYAFFAYYPYAEVSGYNSGTITIGGKNMGTIQLSSANAVSDPVLTYTMPYQGYLGGTPLDRTQTPDLMVAYNIDRTSGEGPVKMDFRHLLCGMEFEVNNFTEQEVKITQLQFSGTDFYKTIKITGQNQGTEVSGAYSGDFTVVDGTVTCPANGKLRIADAEGNPVDLLLIADENGNITSGSYGSSSIKITYGGSSRTFPLSGLKFQAGVKNVFTINFIGNDVVLEMRATDNWEDGGDSDITFE